MKHRLFFSVLFLVFIGFIGAVPSGKTAVFIPANQPITIHQSETVQPGIWQSNGPRGGGSDTLAVSPAFASDGIAFTGEWDTNFQGGEVGTRLFKSTNYGRNWAVSAAGTEEMGNETAVHGYAFSNNFATDQTVFAATGGGLFQSDDGGTNWVLNEALYQGPPGIINGVAAAPDFADSGHIMATGGYGGMFVSQDGGDSWTTASSNFVTSVVYSPAFAADNSAFMTEQYADGGQVLHRVAKTENRGLTWTQVYSASVNSLAVSPNYANDQTVFAGGAQFHISSDGGNTWITRTIAADIGMIGPLAVSPDYAVDQTIFAGTGKGLYQSADGGDSWQLVPGYENTFISALAISPDWPTHAVLLVGTSSGVFRLLTADMSIGETREATQSLIALSAAVIALAADESLLLTGTHGHGLYGSGDGGSTWQAAGGGGSLYSTVSALAFSPDYALDQTIFMAQGSKYTGYYRSTDAGASWESLYGIYNNASLAISPDFASDQTLFATGADVGEIMKSTDGGDTWHDLVTWDRSRGGRQIALPPDYGENGRLFFGTAQGFWTSPDDGATWEQAETGLVDGYYVYSLKVSPNFAADQTLLAVADWSDAAYHQYFGVFKSVDAGVNWEMVNTGLTAESLKDVAFSPNFASDQTAYLITDLELYRSLTGGESWTVVGAPPEMPFLSGVVADSGGTVFVSSEAGVWRYDTIAQDLIVNGRFEANAAWDLPVTAVPADYATEVVHNGQRSLRIGLVDGPNVYSYSSARQTVTLPADLLAAELTFYVYPTTGEETAVSAPPTNLEDTIIGDAQYAYLYDKTGTTRLETLYWDLSNSQAWQKHTINLKAYEGQEIMLYFGVKNDGQNGMTGLYVDDVSLLTIERSRFLYQTYLPVVIKQ